MQTLEGGHVKIPISLVPPEHAPTSEPLSP